MPTDHRAQVDELMADYRRSQERLAETRRDLSLITETARSKDGSVQVVVGPQGALREVVLADDVYERHRPHQLATTIVALAAQAAQAAARRTADVLAEVLPHDTDPELLLGEHADDPVDPVRRNESRAVDDNGDDEDFSVGSWLQQGPKRT